MIEFIKNIIPRIQKYSKDLDKVENFVEKNWVFINEHGNREEWILERDNKLIMTDSEGTKVGSWELTSTGHLLIKRSDTKYDKLENMFIEDAVLILKYSVKEKPPFILINDNIIKDLDVVRYLQEFEEKQQKKVNPQIKPLPPPQFYKVLESGELSGPEFYVGKWMNTEDNLILNGTYRTAHVYDEKYVEVKNNKITKIYFHISYFYKQKELIIQTDDRRNLSDSKIINASSLGLPIKGWVTIKDREGKKYLVKINNSYTIKRAYIGGLQLILNIIYLLFTFAIIFIIIMGLISSLLK